MINPGLGRSVSQKKGYAAMDDINSLQMLIKCKHPCIAIITLEELYAKSVVIDTAIQLTSNLLLWTVNDGLKNGLISGEQPIEGTQNPAAALYYLSAREDRFITLALDLVEHLNEKHILRATRDLINKFTITGSTLVLIDHSDRLPQAIQNYTSYFTLSLPDEEELEQIVRTTLRSFHQDNPLEINVTRSGLRNIVRNLRGLTRRQAQQIIFDTISEDYRFDNSDINRVLAQKRQMLQTGGMLEYVETPAELSEIGGMRRLKGWLAKRQNATSEKALEFGLTPPRGVLILGVQGAGKSLCAKAIATAWQRPLLRLDTSSLYDRYIGESERRLRMSLKQAEMMAPIVMWIDEIEKAFASAASRSSDGGLSQRMFGTLLTWMQEHQEPVFLVATANDIEALPPELLRKGRFDEIFFVDLPTEEVRRDIFKIHLKKRKQNPDDFNLDLLARTADGFSGSEIEEAIISSLHEAFSRKVPLTNDLIQESVQNSPPLSVTMREAVENLRSWSKGRCVPAD